MKNSLRSAGLYPNKSVICINQGKKTRLALPLELGEARLRFCLSSRTRPVKCLGDFIVFEFSSDPERQKLTN